MGWANAFVAVDVKALAASGRWRDEVGIARTAVERNMMCESAIVVMGV